MEFVLYFKHHCLVFGARYLLRCWLTSAMAYLALSFLGGFQALLADKPITAFESNKVRGLLAYLAVEATGVAHSRSSLAELLWQGYGEENARASLRQTLHHLRKSLG